MASYHWAYIRIMAGTVLGGVVGFYVMHRVEISYKEKMKERLKEMMAQQQQQQQGNDNTELLSDS
ncbi:hypothetical protein J5N97_007564 [Dioscorea zingiberensis]|uniref:Uncharacterized protein n=1 Tax=Dioscorea zingiberensis TaxID=325984 RepID=A0A9D5HUM1_9LILI|nr:hypothetical protein J5N97_007564 [Dioscorea zingiberensis]